MKNLSTIFILCFIVVGLLANLPSKAESPFAPHLSDRFQKLESGSRFLKLSHNFDADSASISSVIVGTLPADSVITKSYSYIDGALVSADSNTFSLTCESSADVLAVRDLSGYAQHDIVTSGGLDIASAATLNLRSSDGCDLTVEIGLGASGITAGSWRGIIEYFQPDN